MKRGLLTKKQFEVLRLRVQGLTQEEIAKRLKTTRVNITIMERRVRQKIEAARETLRLIEKFESPVHVTVKPGTDVFEVPGLVLNVANTKGIHVRENATKIVEMISTKESTKLDGRRVIEPFDIMITSKGDVHIS